MDLLEEFTITNRESVIDMVVNKLDGMLYNDLKSAVDEAIEFRKLHFSDYRDDIDNLLQVVREYVVKPDYMSELLQALTNKINSFVDSGDIDMDTVNNHVNIIPILEKTDSKEVAKAIVTEFHSREDKKGSSDKPESNHERKPKEQQPEDNGTKPVK